jgi:hypothetical protein
MREKIIGVFAVVVAIVSVLSFTLMRAALGDVSNKGEAKRAVTAAVAQLQVEGLRIERWLAEQVASDSAREPFDLATPESRAGAATQFANTLADRARTTSVFASTPPTLIVVFDGNGVVVGRDRSALMRGEKLGTRHPGMMKAVLAGHTGSEVWVDKGHNEQLLASYAPVRGADGKSIGGVLIGTAFGNERLQQASEATSSLPLLAAVKRPNGMELVARSNNVTDPMLVALPSSEGALGSDQVVSLGGLTEDLEGAARTLGGYGDGKQAVIMAVAPAHLTGSFGKLFWPVLGVFVLGIVLTAVAAHMLDNYISQPISDLEDGLLAIINGQTDMRFELEHKVLGGLVFRINSLLNQLLGVREDDTDETGRPSVAPSSSSFGAAINLDERMVSLSAADVEDARALREEAPEDYYKRIFDEYREAKRAVGDPVDHIKFAPFRQRVQASEQKLSHKHGKPFRYKIEAKGGEVVFVAVPLV